MGFGDIFSGAVKGFAGSGGNPWGAVVGGGLAFLGSERRNKADAASARQMMDFQREMSNTAVQRQIRDMQSAGINPILAAKYGGASTPSGAQYKSENSFEKAVNSAYQVSQLQNSQALVKKTNQDTLTSSAQEQKLKADVVKALGEYEKNKAQKQSIEMETAHNARDMVFLPKGISRLALKHTPFNLAGTEFYTWAKKAGHTLLTTNSFDSNDPIYKLPQNIQKRVKQDLLKLEIQRKSQNFSWKEYTKRLRQIWFKNFGTWRDFVPQVHNHYTKRNQ